MQCQYCASELGPDAVNCEKCGATRVTQRTPFGVLVGWAGMTMAILTGIVWLFLIALLAFGQNITGFPWLALMLGTAITVGLMWHSKSTVHTIWVRRED